jgi:hypothetical protein
MHCEWVLLFRSIDRGGHCVLLHPQFKNGEMTVKTEKGNRDAEQRIEDIQSICLREKSTECLCPKCGTRHRVKLLWTGRGMPRKFCPICKHYSNSINDTDPFVWDKAAGSCSAS